MGGFNIRKLGLAATSFLVAVAAAGIAYADSMSELVAAAKKEGELTIIAVPHDWCGYGGIIDGFKAAYGLKMNELNPDGGSGDEIEAIKANKGNKGPQAPDVIDVGLAFGPSAKSEGLLQPYKVSTWNSIPDDQKDPEGYWYCDYYGVLAFEINSDLVKNQPTDWPDLLTLSYLRGCLEEHEDLLAGKDIDDDLLAKVAARIWVLVVQQKQVDIRLTKLELMVVNAAFAKEGW